MQEGNDNLSDNGRAAIRRIKALRTLSEKTGIVTKNEQIQVLIGLDTEEMLLVADHCFKNKMLEILRGAK